MSEEKDTSLHDPSVPNRRPVAERLKSEDKASGESAATQASSAARPQPAAQAGASNQKEKRRVVGIRQVSMTISRVEVLSALKLGFLVSVAFGVMTVIGMALVWFVLDGMHVFANVHDLLVTLNSKEMLDLEQYLEFGRWMSFGVIIAVVNVVLLTALTAVVTLVFNLIAALVGGQRIVVTDE